MSRRGSNFLSALHPGSARALAGLLLSGFAGGCVARVAAPAAGGADVALAAVFGDHAVLQRGKPVPVWGIAGALDPVAVTFRGQTVRTTAGRDGRWTAWLAPLAASSEPADLVVTGRNTVTLHDVVVGEVWLCSGQSNMEFTVDTGGTYQVDNAEAEVAAANYPLIRQLRIERAVATGPAAAAKTSGWEPASPKTVGHFTAVGYFFARDIQRALGVPVGIVLSAWGGTPIESWMSAAARGSTSIAGTIDSRWRRAMGEWPPERVAQYPAAMEAWQKAEKVAQETHTKNPLHWPQPPATNDSPSLPGGLYNGMIAPIEPMAMRGILWYQGETNAERAGEYAELLATLIHSWRDAFGQGDLPFYLVQLASFGPRHELTDRGWARLREAQAQVLGVPATGMAVTVDNSDPDTVHPRDKQDVGRRLALIAEAQAYGIPGEFSGPVFAGAARDGPAMRVRFTHAGDMLVARGGPVRELEVAGRDHVFHPASGAIEGDTLLVSSWEANEPVAVRYAWSNAPDANLYNGAGLPAAPFRSDNW
jgi:sialate O-acetylesterase